MDKICFRSRRRCAIFLQYVLLVILVILLINIYYSKNHASKTPAPGRRSLLPRKLEPMFNVLKSFHNDSDIIYVRKLAIRRRDRATSLAYIHSEESTLQRETEYLETTVKPYWYNYRTSRPKPQQIPWSPELMVPEKFWGVTDVVARSFRYTLNHPALCNVPNLHMLILVPSYVHSQQNRMAIRQSWGRIAKIHDLSIKLVFLLGTGSAYYQTLAEAEDAHFKDMVQEDFADGFGQRTFKTMMALSWFSEYCFNAEYVVILSDNVIPNLYKIVDFIQKLERDENLYIGIVRYGDSPHSTKSDKYMSNIKWDRKRYPPFCERPFWILSRDVVDRMASIVPYTAWMYPEDVYLGVLSVKIGVKPTDYAQGMIHSLNEDPRRFLINAKSPVFMANVIDDVNLPDMIVQISEEIDTVYKNTPGLVRYRGKIEPVTTGDVFLDAR